MFRVISAFIVTSIIAFQGSWALALLVLSCFIFMTIGQILQAFLTNNSLRKTNKLMEESLATATEAIENIHTVVSLEIKEELETVYMNSLRKPLR